MDKQYKPRNCLNTVTLTLLIMTGVNKIDSGWRQSLLIMILRKHHELTDGPATGGNIVHTRWSTRKKYGSRGKYKGVWRNKGSLEKSKEVLGNEWKYWEINGSTGKSMEVLGSILEK